MDHRRLRWAISLEEHAKPYLFLYMYTFVWNTIWWFLNGHCFRYFHFRFFQRLRKSVSRGLKRNDKFQSLTESLCGGFIDMREGITKLKIRFLGTWCFKVSFFHLNEEFYRRSTNITDLLHMIDCPWLVFSLAWIFSMKVNSPLKLDLVKLN